MSIRLTDPTFTEPLRQHYANRWVNQIDKVNASVIIQPNTDLMTQVLSSLLTDLETVWLLDLLYLIEQAFMRGLSYASDQVNRLSPDYQTMSGRTPQDNTILNQLQTEGKETVNNLVNSTFDQVSHIITQGTRERWTLEQIAEQITKTMQYPKNRAVAIAHTEVIHAFNEATRQRWQSWGVKQYRYFTNLDPKVCVDPKKLRDDSIAENGCEGLHNTIWNIEDTIHRPPIHPICRCTILPVIEKEEQQPK